MDFTDFMDFNDVVMISKDDLRKMCFDEAGAVKPKADCRAVMINHLILEEMMDIDEAETFIDKSLREFDLWGEPKLEDLLKEDEESDSSKPPLV